MPWSLDIEVSSPSMTYLLVLRDKWDRPSPRNHKTCPGVGRPLENMGMGPNSFKMNVQYIYFKTVLPQQKPDYGKGHHVPQKETLLRTGLWIGWTRHSKWVEFSGATGQSYAVKTETWTTSDSASLVPGWFLITLRISPKLLTMACKVLNGWTSATYPGSWCSLPYTPSSSHTSFLSVAQINETYSHLRGVPCAIASIPHLPGTFETIRLFLANPCNRTCVTPTQLTSFQFLSFNSFRTRINIWN